MRCKAIAKSKWINGTTHQCENRASDGEFCKTHTKVARIESLQKGFDVCFHALKLIEDRMTDPTDEAYLIAKQALAYFDKTTKDLEQ